jgi:hypothetical protein
MKRSPYPELPAALALWIALAGALTPAASAGADDASTRSARDGAPLALEAAAAWAADARLVYVENDEPVVASGQAGRWGYLFFSPSLAAARAYSVRDGKIRVASDFAFDFDAPPLPAEWLDSDAALAAADDHSRDYRKSNGTTVRSMFLVRGLLDPGDPDRSTWAVVYDAPAASSLWVVVDASSGKVVKTWRG